MKLVDLTHKITPTIPTWDGDCGFHHQNTLNYEDCRTKTKFCVQEFSMKAGIGTHMDAPKHCFESGLDISEIPLEILKCHTIDVRKKSAANYFITQEDIEEYEANHVLIGQGDFVIGYTGWSQYWANPKIYRGDKQIQCPGFSEEAAIYLLKKQIKGLGIDTLSPDGGNLDFPVHYHVLGAGGFIVENLTNLDSMLGQDKSILCIPLKIQGATESPIRALGLIV